MRDALRSLTLRGRAFLAGGLTALVCAVVLGQPALTRVGVLAVALPLVTAAVVGRARYRLSLGRSVSPALVPAGQPARVTLTVTNDGRRPRGVLLLEDTVPYVLGTRPRFVLDGVPHGWRRQVTYQVRSDVRGRFELGPMTVRVGDPFGMVEAGRAFHSVSHLVVTPRTTPLPTIALGAAWTGSGDQRPRSFASGTAEDVTVRAYRRGDDLRRVHWRSSARVGELMVRREEQPWQARATVFLDHRERSHRGHGVASSLEAAVSVAASVAAHLVQRGFSVRLVTAAGEDPATAWRTRDTAHDVRPLLESLAVLSPQASPRLDTGWLTEGGHGLTVAVLGSVDAADLPVLRRVQQYGAALAIALEVDAWVDATATGAGAAALVAAQGWRAASLSPRDRLDTVWKSLEQQRGRGTGGTGGTGGAGGAGGAGAVGAVATPPARAAGADGAGRVGGVGGAAR